MKRTKNFFIALLGFCLMGSAFVNAEETILSTPDGYLYQEHNGVFVVIGYAGGETILTFPTINGEKVDVFFDSPSDVQNSSSVVEVDLTNVRLIYTGAFIVKNSPFGGKSGFLKLQKVKIGVDNSFDEDAFSVSTVTDLSFSSDVEEVTSSMVAPFKATVTNVDLTGVNSIGASAFAGCTNLTSIEFKEVSTIGASAFANCTKLTSIELKEVSTIGNYAFSGCSSLTSKKPLDLSSVEEIGEAAFKGTSYLAVSYSDYMQSFPKEVFAGCNNLSDVYFNANVSEICEKAFYGCAHLEDFDFGGIQIIGNQAFATSKLKSTLSFGYELKSVGNEAFSQTNIASTVTFLSSPTIGTAAFPNKELVLRIDDATAFKYYSSATFDRVEYTRSAPTNYAAIALPFDFEKGGNTYYELTSFDLEGGMHFTEVETPVANTPYLYQGDDEEIVSSGTYSPSEDDRLDVAVSTAVEDWEAVCVYKDHSKQSGAPIVDGYYKWAVQGGSLKYFNGQMYMKPYRAYWRTSSSHVSQNARVFVHTRDGNVTSINMAEIDGWENMVPVYYDLTGRMVNNPVKGNIYIVNGKKVVF